jgi:hydroxymethylglutaryl-CoA lyase
VLRPKNINCSIDESLEKYQQVMEMALTNNNIPVRGYVSCVIACPYEGVITPRSVAYVTERLLQMGCYEVSLGDTIGVGTPTTTIAMLEAAVLASDGPEKLAVHFHDTL